MKKNALEWSVFFASLLLILSLVVYLVYQIVTYKDSPPNLRVATWVDEEQAEQYTVHVSLENVGGQTAENVHMEVLLLQDGIETDRANLQIGFAPKGSIVEGWVTFKSDPTKADSIFARILGYNKP